MPPDFVSSFETTNPYQDEARIECMFCYKRCTPKTILKDKIRVEILSDLFTTFKKYMKWKSPKEHQFDFWEEQFPFCSSCSNNLVRVFKLDEQIQNVISNVSSTIIASQENISGKKRDGATQEKLEFYRRQTIEQHQPSVLLIRVEHAEPARLEKEPCTDFPEQCHTTEDNILAPVIPFKSHSSSLLSTDKNTATADPLIQRLGQTKFLYDNKYIFTRSKNLWQCSACLQSYTTNLDLFLHWQTAPCFSSQLPIEIIETFPSHDKTGPASSSAQKPDERQRAEMSKPSLKEHKLTVHLESCGRRTEIPGTAQSKSLTASGKYKCQFCRGIFNGRVNLQEHIWRLHTPDKDKAFECRVCGKKYGTNNLLKKHFRIHDKVECEICKGLYSVNSMYGHKYLVHKSVYCRVCSKTFSVDLFKEHVKWHKEQDPHGRRPASRDPRNRQSRFPLHRTRRRPQGSEQPTDFVEAFPSNDKTLPPSNIAQRPDQLQLEQMSNKRQENQLSPQKHGRNFICTLCGSSYTRNDHLKRHILKLHTDESCKPFPCQICCRKFATKSLVKEHMHSHRKIHCSTCNKIYRLGSISEHRIHHKDAVFSDASCSETLPRSEFECKLCRQSFPMKWSLSQHSKSCGNGSAANMPLITPQGIKPKLQLSGNRNVNFALRSLAAAEV